MTSAVDDAGLTGPRTELAWQRTALSIAAAAAVMARLTWGSLGAAAIATLTVAVLLSGWVYVESRRLDRRDPGVRAPGSSRGGRAPVTLAVCVALVAGTELAAVLAT